jgi:neurotrimin
VFLLQVGWMRAEDQTILTLHTKVVTHNSRISVSHDNQRTWNLHIRQVKEADRGCYMCQINTSVMKKQIGCVDVHGEFKAAIPRRSQSVN